MASTQTSTTTRTGAASTPAAGTGNRKRRAANVPANETPEARFVRVATAKVNSIIKAYRTLARLKGSKAVSTPAQRTAIDEALKSAHAEMLDSLNGKAVAAGGFKL